MARKIAALTQLAGLSKVYYGGEGGESTLSPVYQAVHPYKIIRVNKFDPRKIAVASDTILLYSADGGATWSQQTLDGVDEIRQLQWIAYSTLIITKREHAWKTTDPAASLTVIPLPGAGEDVMDSFWSTTLIGWMLKNDVANEQGHLFYTINGGVAWNPFLLNDIPTWVPEEAPRRVMVWTGGTVLILTSKGVFSGTHNPDFSVQTFARIWDYEAVVDAIPGNVPAGYILGVDENTRFDDIDSVVPGGRIWLAGFQSLRAHSTGGTFFLTDIDSITPDPLVYYTHSVVDALHVFAGSSENPASLFPLRPGLNQSSNGGTDMGIYKNFGSEFLTDHDAVVVEPVLGCSDPDACNYEPPDGRTFAPVVTQDDGSCESAVRLVGCQSGQVISTQVPEIVLMGCLQPSVVITITSMTADTDQQVDMTSGGLIELEYSGNFSISTGFSMVDRIAAFISEFVASFNANANAGFRAISTAAGSVTIIADNPNYAGEDLDIAMFGVSFSASSPQLSEQTPGRVIKIEDYDECFYVCGRGNCVDAIPVTLVEEFDNCLLCDVRASGNICLNCSNMVSFNGVPLRTSNSFDAPECIGVQGELSIAIRASLPIRVYPSVALSIAYSCTNAPVIFSVTGNHTSNFPALSKLTTVPNGHVYTVASSSFDPNTGITFVTTVEACQGDEETAIRPFDPCSCGVTVIYDEWVGGAWTVIDQQTFSCVNGAVTQDIVEQVDHSGQYRIRVIATDCVDVQECVYYMVSCHPLTSIETECHKFSIRPTGNWHDELTGPDGNIKITDMVSGMVLVEEVLPWTSVPFTIETTKDTLLIVEITFGEQRFTQEVLDLCDLRACMKAMISKLLCQVDPCETSDCTEALAILRADSNNANVILGEIERVLRTYRYRWLGVFDYDAAQLKDLSAVVDLIKTARLISGRCGECEHDATSTPCNNCSPA